MSTPLAIRYVTFDEAGAFVDEPLFLAGLAADPPAGSTDVFVFSHGWNNSFADASELYGAVLAQMAALGDATPGLRPDPYAPLAFGVIWPSKAWDDDAGGGLEAPGPAPLLAGTAEVVYEALSPARATAAGFRHDVLRVQQFLAQDHLAPDQAKEFRALLRRHAEPASRCDDESAQLPAAGPEGLDGLEGFARFSARDVFRAFTYWQMKRRAGVVGQTGVRAAVRSIQDRFPAARVHLLGHSFGCKVMLAAVAGPGDPLPRPVDTLILLQGAVSHEAMADQVTGEGTPGGYRAARDGRVAGPVVATFSALDSACSRAYLHGSRLAGQTGELEGLEAAAPSKYSALGGVGAYGVGDAVHVKAVTLPVGGAYNFGPGRVWSVNGGPSGGGHITGHSDIRSPEIAWLIWSAVRRH